MQEDDYCKSNRWLTTLTVDNKISGISRTEISGNTSKVAFRTMRINKIKKQINEILAKKKRK